MFIEPLESLIHYGERNAFKMSENATLKGGESMATAEDDDKVYEDTNYVVSSDRVADIMSVASTRIVWLQTVVLLSIFCIGF